MGEQTSEYLLIDYIDDIEEAMLEAERQGLGEEVISGINGMHGDFTELCNLAQSEVQYEKIKDDMEDLIRALVKTVQDGGESLIAARLRNLRTGYTV